MPAPIRHSGQPDHEGLPDAPQHLEPSVQAVWNDVADQVRPASLIQQLDLAMYEQFCEVGARRRSLQADIHKNGVSDISPTGRSFARPEFTALAAAEIQVHNLCKSLMFSPAKRGGLNMIPVDSDDDPKANYLDRPKRSVPNELVEATEEPQEKKEAPQRKRKIAAKKKAPAKKKPAVRKWRQSAADEAKDAFLGAGRK